jgi:SanA protein
MKKYLLMLWQLLKISGPISIVILMCFNFYIKQKYNSKIVREVEKTTNTKVAIIFGAGIRNNGEPSAALAYRLNSGIELYKQGKVQKLLLSGDNRIKTHDELTCMAAYCQKAGIDTADIFLDYAGFDTYSTIYRAKAIFGVEEAILVSQKFHLGRALFIADKLGLKAQGLAAENISRLSTRRSLMREYLASAKAAIDCARNRQPKFLGEKVAIDSTSNFKLQPLIIASK